MSRLARTSYWSVGVRQQGCKGTEPVGPYRFLNLWSNWSICLFTPECPYREETEFAVQHTNGCTS